MKTLFVLAWRNIWRNKRRTFITAGVILYAVLLSTVLQSIQKGAWDRMVDSVVSFYFGYAQIHSDGYWEEQSLDKAFPITEEINNLEGKVQAVKSYVPRIESFALASHGTQTRGVLVIGVEPEKENAMTQLADRVVEGTYFQAGEKSTIIAEGVAKLLKLNVNDTLVLISQGYHGVNAAGKFLVNGIVKFGSPELNKQMVYLPLETAQYFYGAEGLLTSLALQFDNKDEVAPAIKLVKSNLGADYEVLDWKEMMPDLLEARAMDDAGNYLIMVILYVIISFGIFGTILMMTKEREYEFGILLAIGMKRLKLTALVWMEIAMLGLIGAIAGILVSVPIVKYFNVNPLDFTNMEDMSQVYENFGFEPIFPAAFEPGIFLTHAGVVFIMTSLLALYPLFKIRKLEPVQAMRA